MDLHIYSRDFKYIGVIDTYTSLLWRAQVFEAGEFQMQTEPTENNIALFMSENIVVRDDEPTEFAVLDGLELDDTGDGAATAVVTGRLDKAYFDRCVIDKTYNFNGKVEEAMRLLVSEQMPRIVKNIELGPLQGFTERVEAQVTYKNLLTVLTAFSRATGVLFRLRPEPDRGVFVFETYKGVDRTINQITSPRVTFSDLEETLGPTTYTYNERNYKNFAIIAGEGEGAERVVVTLDRTAGEPRRELFVDAKDLRKEGLTDAQYRAQLLTRGGEKLDAAVQAQSFESSIKVDTNYIYRKDYALGDLVTTHKAEWGIQVSDRITEVLEVYEGENSNAGSVTPTFGSALPEKLNLGG